MIGFCRCLQRKWDWRLAGTATSPSNQNVAFLWTPHVQQRKGEERRKVREREGYRERRKVRETEREEGE